MYDTINVTTFEEEKTTNRRQAAYLRRAREQADAITTADELEMLSADLPEQAGRVLLAAAERIARRERGRA